MTGTGAYHGRISRARGYVIPAASSIGLRDIGPRSNIPGPAVPGAKMGPKANSTGDLKMASISRSGRIAG
jgi:hypothetical protein